jgi:hypothetical protein
MCFEYHEEFGETFTSRYYENNYSTYPSYYSQINTFKNEYESFLQSQEKKKSLLFSHNRQVFEDQLRSFQPKSFIIYDREEDILNPFYIKNFNNNNRDKRFNTLLNDLCYDVEENITHNINEDEPTNSITREGANEKINNSNIKISTSLLGVKRKVQDNVIRKKHTLYDKDNMIIKVKKHVQIYTSDFLNYSLKESHNGNLKQLELYKIDTSFLLNIHKDYNLNLLETKLEDIFSRKLSRKYKSLTEEELIDYNKKIIDKIYEENDKELIDKLQLTFGKMIKLYANNLKGNDEESLCLRNMTKLYPNFKNFKNIDYDIKKFEKQYNQDYIKAYRKVAENFEEEIKNIIPRPNRNSKN